MEKSGDKFVLRQFTLGDYEEYISWWDDVPPSFKDLPAIGLVSGNMNAVGFLARTDCDFSIITWWYTNPKNKNRESYCSLKKIIQGLVESSKIFQKSKVFCYTNNRGMIKLLESLGFVNYDGHLILRLENG